jgi:transposase
MPRQVDNARPGACVNVLKKVRTKGGWKLCPVVRESNGCLRDRVRVNGRTEVHSEGVYYLEWREDGRRLREAIPNHAEVLERARLKSLELEARRAGVVLDVIRTPEAPRSYPSEVTDEEWAFVTPYLAVCKEDAQQRDHGLRAVLNGLRYIVRTGGQWRYMPNDLPPWPVVYQQTQRWIRARCFETMVEDLRMLLREFAGRKAQPTAMILDGRTLQSTPEFGARAGYDGAKRRKGSKVHAAVDTLGHLLALHVTPADEQDRAQVGELAGQVQQITEENVELAYVDQGNIGEAAGRAAYG